MSKVPNRPAVHIGGVLDGLLKQLRPEAEDGSDLGAIRTRARESGGEIRLEGEKIYITNGGSAVHLVLARDDDSYDASLGTTNGISLYL